MPEAVIHPTPQQLTAFGLGKLPELAAAAIAAHLESCSTCRQAVAQVTPDSFLGKVRDAGPHGSSFPPALQRPANAPSSAGQQPMNTPHCPNLPPELAQHPKYRILRELGRGGMGVVYQARQTGIMDRQVVIKVISRALIDQPAALERFLREVHAAAQLSHPNIVTAYDADQAGELHMLVMEFVPGQSLAEVLQKKGPLPVASLAVLADDDTDWRPADFSSSVFGCEAGIRFPAVKLLDFAAHEAMLEASSNPFAQVVLAHLKARETHGDPASRCDWKIRLVRNLLERGFSLKDVRELFRVIDWLMELPPALAHVFTQELDKIQEERSMPYITSTERIWRGEGICLGIEALLEVRFGEEGLKLMPEIRAIHEEEKLEAILQALKTAASLEEVRRIWLPGTP